MAYELQNVKNPVYNSNMKNLIIIAAIGRKRELGHNNDLIWRIKEDLQFFRDTTMGHYMFMGRKTYDSLPDRLAEGRKYLVLSREVKSSGDIKAFASIDEFLEFARATDEDIYVIGGGAVYSALLQCTNKMILTEIDDDFADADVFFPSFDKTQWDVERGEKQTDGDLTYRRNIYIRRT